MSIKKLNEKLSKVLNEFYVDPETANETVEEYINELVDAGTNLYPIPKENDGTIKDLIRTYSRIEHLATEISRYADYMQVELEDRFNI